MKEKVLTIAKLVISILLLIYLLTRIDLSHLLLRIKEMNLFWLSAATVMTFLHFLIKFLRLKILMEYQGIRFSYGRISLESWKSRFFGQFLPGKMGSDVFNYYFLSRYSEKKDTVLSTIVFWRYSGAVCMMLICFLSGIVYSFLSNDTWIVFWIFLTLIVIVIFPLILFYRTSRTLIKNILDWMAEKFHFSKLRETSSNIYRTLIYFSKDKHINLINIALSILAQTVKIGGWYYIALGLHLKVSFIYFLFFIPMIAFVKSLPISINGLGVGEGASIVLFSKVGLTFTDAFLLSMLNNLILFSLGLIGALAYIIEKMLSLKKGLKMEALASKEKTI